MTSQASHLVDGMPKEQSSKGNSAPPHLRGPASPPPEEHNLAPWVRGLQGQEFVTQGLSTILSD